MTLAVIGPACCHTNKASCPRLIILYTIRSPPQLLARLIEMSKNCYRNIHLFTIYSSLCIDMNLEQTHRLYCSILYCSILYNVNLYDINQQKYYLTSVLLKLYLTSVLTELGLVSMKRLIQEQFQLLSELCQNPIYPFKMACKQIK